MSTHADELVRDLVGAGVPAGQITVDYEGVVAIEGGVTLVVDDSSGRLRWTVVKLGEDTSTYDGRRGAVNDAVRRWRARQ